MSILADNTAPIQHQHTLPVPCGFDWCIVELGDNLGDGPLHVGNDLCVQTHAYPTDQHDVTVSLESYVGQVPSIRLAGAGDAPMTPGDALALAQLLVAAARQAYGLPR